ncbi:MAG: HAMP domain-containing protein [Chloroflexi bacterium]|nr:HAMP domain-containing protein [Chloroflexota bacterium]
MSIRWRLTLWFAIIILVVLVVGGVVLHTLLQNYLNSEVDNNLQNYSARVHGISHTELGEPYAFDAIHSRLPLINEFASPGIYLQLVDRSGKVVVKSENLGEQELPVNPVLMEKGFAGQVTLDTLSAGDGVRVRIMVSPLYLKDQTLLLEAAQSLKLVDITMGQLRAALLTGVLVSLVLVVTSGAFVVRRTLSPMERVTRTAQSIEASSDLTRRVGYEGQDDEMARLATTFDHMVERLNKAFESQKHFVADASHELRGPLTVIQGNLDLLKRNLSDEDRRESLRAIEAEARRMTAIVNDLLVLAEVEAGHIERKALVPLREVVLETANWGEQLAGSRKVVTGRLQDISISGDAHHLRQLLRNLVDNAIKYTPDSGVITVSLFKDSTWACLQVEDTGIGIASEHLPYIFDRFYRVDKARSRAKGGTGLGLAIVKGIAEQHGGKVTVQSEPGKGSIFIAWLKL